MDQHADIKDKCDDLDTRIELLCEDIRGVSTTYKIVDQCYKIDEQLSKIYEWYENTKEVINKYNQERERVILDLEKMDTELKVINNTIQNAKSQAFSRDRHGGSYSLLRDIQHP
jgi:uncharacterized coiled-coil DUF342 family protein